MAMIGNYYNMDFNNPEANKQATAAQHAYQQGGAESPASGDNLGLANSNFYSSYHHGLHVNVPIDTAPVLAAGALYTIANAEEAQAYNVSETTNLNNSTTEINYGELGDATGKASAQGGPAAQSESAKSASAATNQAATPLETAAAASSGRTNPANEALGDTEDTTREAEAENDATEADEANRADETGLNAETSETASTEPTTPVPEDLQTPATPNAAPTAGADAASATEDQAGVVNIDVLANDSDPDAGDTLSVTELNGNAITVGIPVTLARGATVTLLNDGTFDYAINNAYQSLGSGDTASETFTYTIDDGSGHTANATVTVNITGSEDAPVIGGVVAGATSEDGTLTVSNNLTTTDADAADTPTFTTQSGTAGTYGTLDLAANGTWTYTLNNATAQTLAGGQTATETFSATATTADGESVSETITITVNGTEDAPVITGTNTGATTEDGSLTVSNSLTAADPDATDSPTFTPQSGTAGTYGTLDLAANGTWTYTLNNATAQTLAGGQTATETFTATATTADGESVSETVTITVNGTEDTPVITGTNTGATTEDGSLTVSNTLATSDVDAGDNPTFTTQSGTARAYGTFDLAANGTWTYTLNNTTAQTLDAGETATETFTATATTADGESVSQNVTITVNGTEDAPVVSGTFTDALTEANIGDTVTATGTIGITDIDANDNPVFNNTSVAGTYGTLNLVGGNWTYTLDQTKVQQLNANDSVVDSMVLAATDGTQQAIDVTITGSNDAPTISATSKIEMRDGKAVAGQLKAADVDSSQLTYTVLAGPTEGVLTLNADGTYTYNHDKNNADTDGFTYQVEDAQGAITTGTVSISTFDQNQAQTIAGGEGVDALEGSKKADTITGGGGDDTIYGQGGADNIDAGAGDDTIHGGGGSDTIEGGAGSDTVAFGNTNKDITVDLNAGTSSGEGNDTLSNIENVKTARGSDTIIGDANDNVIEGGAGADTITGGLGSDTASYAGSDAGVTVDLGAGTASGGHATGDILSGIENLTGSEFNDVLTGDASTNVFQLGGGTDTASGGAGADVFMMSLGDDANTIYGNTAATSDSGNWTDSIVLADSNTGPDPSLAPSGESDWLLTTSDSYTVTENTLTFDSGDASGSITMSDGSTITFTDIDEIRWD